MTEFRNSFTSQAFTPSQYEETPEGFLRVHANVLAQRVMPYANRELTNLPKELQNVDPIMMLVTVDEMAAQNSMHSLEGAAVVAPDHQWIENETLDSKKGNTAGSPRITNGKYLNVDLLITHPDAVQAIRNREIGEISGAYTANTVFEPGTFEGQPYHCKQVNLIWNHVAVIPFGTGRAGSDVRIINHKNTDGGEKMAEKTLVKVRLANTGRFINVDEEAAEAIQAEGEASESKAEAAAEEGKVQGSAGLEDLMKQVEELKAQKDQLQGELDEALGQLSVFKDELDRLMSDDGMGEAIEAQAQESGDADEIIENACLSLGNQEAEALRNSFQRIGNTGLHRLHGLALQEAVLNSVGFKTENMSPAEIRGAFKARQHVANTMKAVAKPAPKTANGGKIFQNSTPADGPSPAQRMVNAMFRNKEQA